jgi:exodeoxyribonuclease VII large subunit
MENPVRTVSEIVKEVKHNLESAFTELIIEGEVSNLSSSGSGHWYFTLSDRESSLSAACFKFEALRNPLLKNLKDGDRIQCYGSLSVYLKRGTFQLIVSKIRPVGKGDLLAQFYLLKEKLQKEGLFETHHKKKISSMPQKIAIITAQQGAALRDFIEVYSRRSVAIDLLIIPALVQGDHAAGTIIQGLKKIIKYNQANLKEPVEVVVITRGGGSLEDLWAFNDENLAREIFAFPLPIISAIGHQVDFTIADFVADQRCETPSAAGEFLTTDQMMIKEKLTYYARRLTSSIQAQRQNYLKKMAELHPRRMLDQVWNLLYEFQEKLRRMDVAGRIYELTQLHEYYLLLDDLKRQLLELPKQQIQYFHQQMERLGGFLAAVDPQQVLKRGYSFLLSTSGNVIGSAKKYDEQDKHSHLQIKFFDGLRKIEKI